MSIQKAFIFISILTNIVIISGCGATITTPTLPPIPPLILTEPPVGGDWTIPELKLTAPLVFLLPGEPGMCGTHFKDSHKAIDYFSGKAKTEIKASAPGRIVKRNSVCNSQQVLNDKIGSCALGANITVEYTCDLIDQETRKRLGCDKGQSIFIRYSHLESGSEISAPDDLEAGDTIGLVGSTGKSTGPHTHVEVKIGTSGSYYSFANLSKNPINPELVFPKMCTGYID